jgi:signal transduction histidine kinase
MNAEPARTPNATRDGSAPPPTQSWTRDAGERAARLWAAGRAWVADNTLTSQWLPERWQHPALSYVLAAVVQMIALGVVAVVLDAASFHEALMLLGLLLVALSWGAAPGLFATLLTIGMLAALILPPVPFSTVVAREDVAGLVLLFVVGSIISVVAGQNERARRSAHAANERMDQFLNVVSHELRSPIASLKGNVQLAMRQLSRMRAADLATESDPSPYLDRTMEALKRTEQQVDRLNRLVADLLEAARADSGKLEVHLAPFDLSERLSVIVDEHRQGAPEREIRACLPQAPVIVRADPDRVEQVVLNYLSNALKYSAQQAPVEVKLEPAGGEARVAVRDYGPGLTAEQRRDIWLRGYRAKGMPAYSAGSNLGLGLYISRMLIEEQSGSVGVESAPGAGSTFWFTLPLANS